MYKTLCLSFSLRNTYRVNGILYSLKQIPLLKKILPQSLYQARELKILANVLSVLWEIISIFAGKLIYFMTMVIGIGALFTAVPSDRLFLHMLLFLSVIGAYMNTSIFNPTEDKYYAMILMRMDAKAYTLVNYGYAILKVILGFLPFTVIFGLSQGISLWVCILLPFCIAGVKLSVAAYSLWVYEKSGSVRNENKIDKKLWLFIGCLLALAYGLPAVGIALPSTVSMILMLALIPLGAISVRKIISCRHYRQINQELLSQMRNQMDEIDIKQIAKTSSEKSISADTAITSDRKGFEYLNELFIKRHQKILWKATVKIAAACVVGVIALLLVMQFAPESKSHIREMTRNGLPYFAFIMYAINRGTGFTQALFMNCDHSLLTYSFYKQPEFVLRLFKIRLREIVKINAVPALVIGTGLSLILYASGGVENPLYYGVVSVSILAMSVFFSIHYLTMYYLLQPYNAGTELKSGTYQLVMSATYMLCMFVMQMRVPVLVFGIGCIVFCVLYSVIACVLVYWFAPSTFRIRS